MPTPHEFAPFSSGRLRRPKSRICLGAAARSASLPPMRYRWSRVAMTPEAEFFAARYSEGF